MKIVLSNEDDALKLVKRMVFLAYTAVSSVFGMGILQAARNGGRLPTEEQVWDCAYNSQDYGIRLAPDNAIYCDYVFGAMMKWGCKWEGNIIIIPDTVFDPDYQGFCYTYADNSVLVRSAADTLGIVYGIGL
jgi:hypothetical protein